MSSSYTWSGSSSLSHCVRCHSSGSHILLILTRTSDLDNGIYFPEIFRRCPLRMNKSVLIMPLSLFENIHNRDLSESKSQSQVPTKSFLAFVFKIGRFFEFLIFVVYYDKEFALFSLLKELTGIKAYMLGN